MHSIGPASPTLTLTLTLALTLSPTLTLTLTLSLTLTRPASPSQLRRMFLKFFPAQDEHAERFVTNLAACQLSMALLQSYFMLYRDSAEQVTLALALALANPNPSPSPSPSRRARPSQLTN